MFTGALIAESLVPGAELRVVLTVTRVERLVVDAPAPGQPPVWTVLHFATEDGEALAGLLQGMLLRPGWYCDFRSPDEVFVVFAGQVFRYAPGDVAGRAAAEARRPASRRPSSTGPSAMTGRWSCPTS